MKKDKEIKTCSLDEHKKKKKKTKGKKEKLQCLRKYLIKQKNKYTHIWENQYADSIVKAIKYYVVVCFDLLECETTP